MRFFIKYSLVALLSAILLTSVNAATTANINLTGIIYQSVFVEASSESTVVTMVDGVTTEQAFTVGSNVDFTLSFESDLKMKNSDGDFVSYTLSMVDSNGNAVANGSGGATGEWKLKITPVDVNKVTAAGVYSDTITLTAVAL